MPNQRIRAIQRENSKKVGEDGLPLVRKRRQPHPVDTRPFQTCRPNRAARWTNEPMRLKTVY